MKLKLRLRKRPKWIPVLPTLLTLGNAVCGFGAITFAAKVGPERLIADAGGPVDASNQLFVAAVLVYLGMVFDMLDGHTARLTKQITKLGAELDSMCDVITFGVAPSFIMLKYAGLTFAGANENPLAFLYHPRLLWGIAVLYTLCAVMRLARFNVETGEEDSHDSFSGLPSPAAAGTLVSFAVVLPGLNRLAESESDWARQLSSMLLSAGQIVLPLLTLAVAWLMVSRIRYPHLFNQLFRGRRNYRHVVQLVAASLAVLLMHELAVPLIFCWFVLASPLRAFWSWMAAGRPGVAAGPAPEVSPPGSQDIPQS